MYQLRPIGIVHSLFKRREDVPTRGPIQYEAIGEIEIFKEYEDGLKDIDGFSHIVVLWIFHQSKGYELLVGPLAYKGLRGVFATGHPDRPNPIGLTVVKLICRDKNVLRVKGIDMADRSPVVDIKPYVYSYVRKDIRLGWIETAERR
jgi:tRNA-Thr(GGU) m(6)t(6)A37 methyltransferase TsaA